jgi:RNA polymerase sigma factor (sigma-70 family)
MEASAAPGRSAHVRPAPLGGRLLRLASDERLVEHVREGSERAFEVLFDRHHRAILSFSRHMLGDPTEAEDAAQHTFLAAYRDLVGSDKPIQLKPWLYTIARNRCLSVLRGRRERPLEGLEEPSTAHLSAEVEQRADLQDLLRDLAALPEDQRAALVLSELGDVSHDEIAAVIGCRREKVKALVFQARSSLAAGRQARDTDCTEIREQLATLSGGSLRRRTLRRHVKECAGCRAFADEVGRQRRDLALVLPVVPTLGLKDGLFAAISGSGTGGGAGLAAAGGGAAAGAAAAGGAGGGAWVAKALVVAAVAGGGGTAGVAKLSGGEGSTPAPAPAAEQATAAGQGGAGPAGGGPGGGPAPAAQGGQDTADRARSGDTPIKRRVGHARKQEKGGPSASRGRGAAPPGRALGRDDRPRGGGRETKEARDACRLQRANERAARTQERRAAREQQRQQRVTERPRPSKPAPQQRRSPAPPPPAPKASPTPAPKASPAPKPKLKSEAEAQVEPTPDPG